MKKYKNFFNLFILLFVFLSISGCFASKNAFDKNKQLYNEYISSNNTQYYYAEKIIENISDREKYDSYQYFKIILSLKTEPFDKNIENIKKIKNKKIKIDACIQGANKYLTLQKNDISDIFIFLAEKELSQLTSKNQELNFQIAVLYNQLLLTALKKDNYSTFEKICSNLIKNYPKKNYRPYELRPLMISIKKYMLSCCKKNLKFADKILNFAETIAWEMEPYNNKIIPELNLKPNQTDLVFAAFFNPQRQRALSLIQLAEIYSCLKEPQKIYPIYLELVRLWKISLENPHKGKSFEVYLPGFIKLLFKENYKKEALYFTSLIPEIFPFYIRNDTIAKRQTISYYQFKLKEYNKKGNFHKYRCLKAMALLINKEKGCESALQWIKKNTDNKDIKLKLFNELSYIEKHKNNKIINEIKNLYPAYDKETITINSLKNLYIPVLLNLYSLNKSKGDKFLLLITNKIMQDLNEDSPVILMRLSRSLKQANYQESTKICKKSFKLIYSLPKNDPIERLKCINQLVKIIGKTADQCFDKNELLNYLSETIENISIPGNKDRLYEIKIDSLLLIVDLMNYLEKKDETLKFLEQTNQYIQLLSNEDLKKSYKLVLFFKYADFEFFDEAFKISKQINFENYEKEYLINKISMLFIFNKINEKRWLFFDIDNNGKIDFINPEADKKFLNLKR